MYITIRNEFNLLLFNLKIVSKNVKKKPKIQVFINITLIVIVFGIVYYVIKNSLASIFDELFSTPWQIVLVIILLGIFYQLLEGENIHLIVLNSKKQLSLVNGFFCSCYVAFCRVITFGSGTLLSEIFFYRKKNIETARAVGITTLKQIINKISCVTICIVMILINFSFVESNYRHLSVLILYGVLGTIITTSFILYITENVRVQKFLFKTLHNLKFLNKWDDKIVQLEEQVGYLRSAVKQVMSHKRTVISIVAFNVLKLFPWYLIPFITLYGDSITFMESFTLISLVSVLAGMLPTPAGLGSFEFVYLLFFKPIVGPAAAGSSLLLYRFATYVLPFLIGGIYALITKQKELKHELDDAKPNS